MSRLHTYARICPVLSDTDGTCQLEVQSLNANEHILSLEIPYFEEPTTFSRREEGGSVRSGNKSGNVTPNHYSGSSTPHHNHHHIPGHKGLFNGRVFTPSESQESVYSEFSHYIDAMVEGITGCVFAYGQTGTGKTYTMYGGSKYNERGLIPRLICGLFSKVREKKKKMDRKGVFFDFKVSVKCLEVYNDQGFDLLRSHDEERPSSWKIDLFQRVPNLAERGCESEREALDCVFLAAMNRSDARTRNNKNSSRSHAIFTVILNQELGEDCTRICSKLHLVDLAGSERVYKAFSSSGYTSSGSYNAGGGGNGPNGNGSYFSNYPYYGNGPNGNGSYAAVGNPKGNNLEGRIVEAKSINKSLHFLEQVVIAIQNNSLNRSNNGSGGEGKKSDGSFVPFRNSIMTFLLKDALIGNCRTSLIATISPLLKNAQESVSTIRFAQRCSSIVLQTEVKPNVSVNYKHKALRLETENQKLMQKISELETRETTRETTRESRKEEARTEKESLTRDEARKELPRFESPKPHPAISSQNSAAHSSTGSLLQRSGDRQRSADLQKERPNSDRKQPGSDRKSIGKSRSLASGSRHNSSAAAMANRFEANSFRPVALKQLGVHIPPSLNELSEREYASMADCLKATIAKYEEILSANGISSSQRVSSSQGGQMSSCSHSSATEKPPKPNVKQATNGVTSSVNRRNGNNTNVTSKKSDSVISIPAGTSRSGSGTATPRSNNQISSNNLTGVVRTNSGRIQHTSSQNMNNMSTLSSQSIGPMATIGDTTMPPFHSQSGFPQGSHLWNQENFTTAVANARCRISHLISPRRTIGIPKLSIIADKIGNAQSVRAAGGKKASPKGGSVQAPTGSGATQVNDTSGSNSGKNAGQNRPVSTPATTGKPIANGSTPLTNSMLFRNAQAMNTRVFRISSGNGANVTGVSGARIRAASCSGGSGEYWSKGTIPAWNSAGGSRFIRVSPHSSARGESLITGRVEVTPGVEGIHTASDLCGAREHLGRVSSAKNELGLVSNPHTTRDYSTLSSMTSHNVVGPSGGRSRNANMNTSSSHTNEGTMTGNNGNDTNTKPHPNQILGGRSESREANQEKAYTQIFGRNAPSSIYETFEERKRKNGKNESFDSWNNSSLNISQNISKLLVSPDGKRSETIRKTTDDSLEMRKTGAVRSRSPELLEVNVSSSVKEVIRDPSAMGLVAFHLQKDGKTAVQMGAIGVQTDSQTQAGKTQYGVFGGKKGETQEGTLPILPNGLKCVMIPNVKKRYVRVSPSRIQNLVNSYPSSPTNQSKETNVEDAQKKFFCESNEPFNDETKIISVNNRHAKKPDRQADEDLDRNLTPTINKSNKSETIGITLVSDKKPGNCGRKRRESSSVDSITGRLEGLAQAQGMGGDNDGQKSHGGDGQNAYGTNGQNAYNDSEADSEEGRYDSETGGRHDSGGWYDSEAGRYDSDIGEYDPHHQRLMQKNDSEMQILENDVQILDATSREYADREYAVPESDYPIEEGDLLVVSPERRYNPRSPGSPGGGERGGTGYNGYIHDSSYHQDERAHRSKDNYRVNRNRDVRGQLLTQHGRDESDIPVIDLTDNIYSPNKRSPDKRPRGIQTRLGNPNKMMSSNLSPFKKYVSSPAKYNSPVKKQKTLIGGIIHGSLKNNLSSYAASLKESAKKSRREKELIESFGDGEFFKSEFDQNIAFRI